MRLQSYLDAKYKYFGNIYFLVAFFIFLRPYFFENMISICKFNCIAFRFRQHALHCLLPLIRIGTAHTGLRIYCPRPMRHKNNLSLGGNWWGTMGAAGPCASCGCSGIIPDDIVKRPAIPGNKCGC